MLNRRARSWAGVSVCAAVFGLVAAGCGGGAASSSAQPEIDPTTGLPNANIDPVTGLPIASPTSPGVVGIGPSAIADSCVDDGTLNLGRTPLRRLTRDQLSNTLRDLVGTTGTPSSGLAPDERIGPFTSNSISPITDLLVEQQRELAASVALDAVARMTQIAPCDLTTGGEACASQFVGDFGGKAFRRPLDTEEQARFLALYDLGAELDASNGFRVVLEAILQSPQFLYHVDVGEAGVPSVTPVRLTGYELASRLSYFLWNSMPDAELFQRAGDGSLLDQSGVLETQVQRLLSDDRALGAIPLFHLQWLKLEDLASLDKDPAVFPNFDGALADAMLRETVNFTDYVVRRGDGSMQTLFGANFSFLEGPLFAQYGVPQPANFVPGEPVPLAGGSPRAGILTQGAFLTQHAHRNATSPVVRGIVMRENLLCLPIPSPPADVNTTPPDPTPTTTTRERFVQHESNPSCATCHTLFDPMGLSFENYDAVGAYRTTENGLAIDVTGTVAGGFGNLATPFDGILELTERFGDSEQVAECMAAQWLRFALSRVESADDACSLAGIFDGFEASGRNIPALLESIATSDAFRYVRSAGNTN